MKKLLTILFLIPIWVFAQDTTILEVCTHDQSHLQTYSVTNGPNQYYWSVEGGIIVDGSHENSIVVNWLNVPYNMYLITVYVISDAGCYGDTATLWVDIDECSYDGVFVPNSFTPDGDGINDTFKVIGEQLETLDLYIFNRWGGMIYESHNLGEGWDGTTNNEKCQIDVYIWKIKYKFKYDPFGHTSVGHVTLIR